MNPDRDGANFSVCKFVDYFTAVAECTKPFVNHFHVVIEGTPSCTE